jgi:CRISPR-associated protein Csb2
MLSIEIELLAGRYAATEYNDRYSAEWPPHPARFYSALVAALHENASIDEQERSALLWLEQQAAPGLVVDTTTVNARLGRREVRDVFVPVNDITVTASLEPKLRAAEAAVERAQAAVDAKQAQPSTKTQPKELAKLQKELEKAQQASAKQQAAMNEIGATSAEDLKASRVIFGEYRTRQMRTFPVVFPADPRLHFLWESDPAPELRAALDRLCERVTRLGHSSSLVRCAVVERAPAPNLLPDPDGELVLRTVGPGQLARLEQAFERHQAVANRLLPARPLRYGKPAGSRDQRSSPHSVFSDDWIIFERVARVKCENPDGSVQSSRPYSSRGGEIARALRRALIEVHGSNALPPALSGHSHTGEAATTPHIAFVALPYVNHEHADATVKGVAIVLPRALADGDRTTLFQLIADWERTRSVDADGERSVMELATDSLSPFFVRRVELSELHALTPATWCRASTRFVTATPIALDRYPGKLRSNQAGTAHKAALEAQRSIAIACERIGLPMPSSVEVSFAPLVPGAQPARDFFPRTRKPGRAPRVRVHADIRFAQRVCGPVLLGAERYFGNGLCVPAQE